MRLRWNSIVASVAVVGIMSLGPAPTGAQTDPAYEAERGPTAPTGPAPRLPNGRPDMSGIWDKPYVPDMTQPRLDHKGIAELPFTPSGLKNWANYDPVDGDYTGNCMPFGFPRSINGPFPMRIMQNDTYIALLFELGTWFHVIPLDGRDLPEDPDPTWFGHSVGRWEGDTLEGDTLVVDSTNFTSNTNFRGSAENLHLVERFTRVSPDTIHYEFTVDDPTTFTRTWTVMIPLKQTQDPIFEYACHEGNSAMGGILRGARTEEAEAEAEAEAAEAAKSKSSTR